LPDHEVLAELPVAWPKEKGGPASSRNAIEDAGLGSIPCWLALEDSPVRGSPVVARC